LTEVDERWYEADLTRPKVLLHRHASAGERLELPRLDRVRQLDAAGRAEAGRLPWLLAGYEIEHVVSSPYRRCLESIEPLAAALGIAVQRADELAPDASLTDTRALLEKLDRRTLVCTHREIFERLFDGRIVCEKGGTWVVERRGSDLVPAEYVPPPSAHARGQSSREDLVRSR
jgi:8-oxo-dGTP diphosphatase